MRPLSVTVVAWWLIVTALLGMYSSANLTMDPLAAELAAGSRVPVEVQQIFGILNGVVLAGCGFAILAGKPWARLAFVAWSLVGFLAGIAIIGFLLAFIMSALSVGIIMFILSRPRANAWFE